VVVDAGCGEGSLVRRLAEDGARYVHGVDTCPEFIESARAHPGHRPESATFHHADVAALPLPAAAADLVVANRLPHGLRRPEERFREFARVLKPTGRLILLGMHPCFYVPRADRAAGTEVPVAAYLDGRTVEQRFSVAGRVSPGASVQRLFSLEAYVGMLTGAGFAITQLYEPHPTDRQRQENPWWEENFVRPLFLLLECRPLR
jgi:SAM-dependent methyltransferase